MTNHSFENIIRSEIFKNLKIWKSDFLSKSQNQKIKFQNLKSQNIFFKSQNLKNLKIFKTQNLKIFFLQFSVLFNFFFFENMFDIFFRKKYIDIFFNFSYQKYVSPKFRVEIILSTPSPLKLFFVTWPDLKHLNYIQGLLALNTIKRETWFMIYIYNGFPKILNYL